jgi:drug/metabolite transporter (DMT)-like permease
MNNSIDSNSFSKSLLAGLLAGIVAAFINLVYVMCYREITGYSKEEIVMPVTIFIGFPFLLAIGGMFYYLTMRHLPSGTRWFVLLCFLLMIALVIVTIPTSSVNQVSLFSGKTGLFLGMEIITCLLAVFLIPYLARHPNIYE